MLCILPWKRRRNTLQSTTNTAPVDGRIPRRNTLDNTTDLNPVVPANDSGKGAHLQEQKNDRVPESSVKDPSTVVRGQDSFTEDTVDTSNREIHDQNREQVLDKLEKRLREIVEEDPFLKWGDSPTHARVSRRSVSSGHTGTPTTETSTMGRSSASPEMPVTGNSDKATSRESRASSGDWEGSVVSFYGSSPEVLLVDVDNISCSG